MVPGLTGCVAQEEEAVGDGFEENKVENSEENAEEVEEGVEEEDAETSA